MVVDAIDQLVNDCTECDEGSVSNGNKDIVLVGAQSNSFMCLSSSRMVPSQRLMY